MLLTTFTQTMLVLGRILLAFVILMFMIMIHELGHFTAGKILKFKINEFAIGMGPKLFKKTTKDGGCFSLRAIPLGGYCAFEGEDLENSLNPAAFNNQKAWKRIIVLISGAAFNFISAILISMIAFSCFSDTVLSVQKPFADSPNYAAFGTQEGFCEGDILYSINGHKLYLIQDISTYIEKADNTIPVIVLRKDANGEFKKVNLTVHKGKYTYEYKDEFNQTLTATKTGLGIQNAYVAHKYTFGQAIGRSVPYCFRAGSYILETLGGIFTGKVDIRDMGGPFTTIDITTKVISTGIANTLFLIVLISVNLAVFNLLPLPALDGSRVVFCLIELIFKKPVNRKVEAIVHTVGLVVLFALMLILDAVRYL